MTKGKPQRNQVRHRARKIKKASKGKLTAKDYMQRALVVLIIVAILTAALLFTQRYL